MRDLEHPIFDICMKNIASNRRTISAHSHTQTQSECVVWQPVTIEPTHQIDMRIKHVFHIASFHYFIVWIAFRMEGQLLRKDFPLLFFHFGALFFTRNILYDSGGTAYHIWKYRKSQANDLILMAKNKVVTASWETLSLSLYVCIMKIRWLLFYLAIFFHGIRHQPEIFHLKDSYFWRKSNESKGKMKPNTDKDKPRNHRFYSDCTVLLRFQFISALTGENHKPFYKFVCYFIFPARHWHS